MDSGLTKLERLCSVTAIGKLVSEGRYVSRGHLRCCFIKRDNGQDNRILVSVGKKYFKRAVKRNLLKRRIREAYRLQKNILPPCGADIMFIYTSRDVASFADIFKAMGSLLELIGCNAPSAQQSRRRKGTEGLSDIPQESHTAGQSNPGPQ